MDAQMIWHFLLDPIDLYCERIDAGIWSEPLNFVSNGAYLLVAWRLYVLAGRVEKERARQALVYLSLSSALVGCGSALFHSWANRLTQSFDVFPITIFVSLCVYFYFRERAERLIPLRAPVTICILLLVLSPIAAIVSGLMPYLSHGEAYLGVVPALVSLSFFEENKSKRYRIIAAALVFALALAARTLDPFVCSDFPSGSHFLWHLLSAAVAYVMASVHAVDMRKSGFHQRT